MSDINLVDVTIHIDNETDTDTREKIDTALRSLNGVVSVSMPDEKPHLLTVEYDPDVTSSAHMGVYNENRQAHIKPQIRA